MLESSADLLQELHQARPVFVWSPIEGCGIDLMQALLQSSREIYFTNPDPFLLGDLPRSMRVRTEALAMASSAPEANATASDLMPDPDLYSTALIRGFAHLCGAYADTAHQAGFHRWGTGLARFSSQDVAIVQGLLPQSRHVLLLRNLEDAVRSGRASGTPMADLRTLALAWSDGVTRALGELCVK